LKGSGRLAAALVAAACLGLALSLHALSRRGMEERWQRQVLRVIGQVAPLSYDNRPHLDRMHVEEQDFFSQPQDFHAYRLRSAGEVQGVALLPVVVRGYHGALELAVGIGRDGAVTGVRVLRHEETPGLGSGVAAPGWLAALRGHSLERLPAARWAVGVEDGAFDQVSGATVSSRAVVLGLRDCLRFYAAHRARLLDEPSASPAGADLRRPGTGRAGRSGSTALRTAGRNPG